MATTVLQSLPSAKDPFPDNASPQDPAGSPSSGSRCSGRGHSFDSQSYSYRPPQSSPTPHMNASPRPIRPTTPAPQTVPRPGLSPTRLRRGGADLRPRTMRTQATTTGHRAIITAEITRRHGPPCLLHGNAPAGHCTPDVNAACPRPHATCRSKARHRRVARGVCPKSAAPRAHGCPRRRGPRGGALKANDSMGTSVLTTDPPNHN